MAIDNDDCCGWEEHEHLEDHVWYDDEMRCYCCAACVEDKLEEYRYNIMDCMSDPDYCDIHFADPGGTSALRAETENNPRNLPCPTCGTPNRLTPEDQRLGYQCDSCADLAERGGY